jgi:hypothetical protein
METLYYVVNKQVSETSPVPATSTVFFRYVTYSFQLGLLTPDPNSLIQNQKGEMTYKKMKILGNFTFSTAAFSNRGPEA